MATKVMSIDSEKAIDYAAELIGQGRVVALPTDTVYGVVALASNPDAVKQIFDYKRRNPEKALPVFISSAEILPLIVSGVNDRDIQIINAVWPGPVTLVFAKKPDGREIYNGNDDSVAIRIPDNAVCRSLLEKLGEPLVVTSANLAGEDTPATAQKVAAHFDNCLPLVLDGGRSSGALPSTIIDLTRQPPRLVRQGSDHSWQILKNQFFR